MHADSMHRISDVDHSVALEKVVSGQSAQGLEDPPEISNGDGKERIEK